MMLTFQFGLCMSFSGIVIAALTGVSNEHNNKEKLTLTGTQASWIGNSFLAKLINFEITNQLFAFRKHNIHLPTNR